MGSTWVRTAQARRARAEWSQRLERAANPRDIIVLVLLLVLLVGIHSFPLSSAATPTGPAAAAPSAAATAPLARAAAWPALDDLLLFVLSGCCQPQLQDHGDGKESSAGKSPAVCRRLGTQVNAEVDQRRYEIAPICRTDLRLVAESLLFDLSDDVSL